MGSATTPTIFDYIDAGLRFGWSARRCLRLLREDGYSVRTAEFYDLWRSRKALWLRPR